MLHHCSIIDGKLAIDDPSGALKIDLYVSPDEAERRHLIENLKLDEHSLCSALDPDETPRIEFEKEHISVILKYPRPHSDENDFHFGVHSIGFFIFSSSYVVSILNEKLSTARIPGSLDGASVEYLNTVQDVLLRVLSQSIRYFERRLKLIGKLKEKLKKTIEQPQSSQNLTDMFTLRESLIYYVDALRGNGYLIARIISAAEKIGLSQSNIENLKDYAIENRQFLEQAQVYSQVLADLMDTCTSISSSNLNGIMKNMNSLVLAISIPSFFTGVGGMSEFTSFTAPYLKWYVSYPLFFGLMAIVSFALYRLFQRYYRG